MRSHVRCLIPAMALAAIFAAPPAARAQTGPFVPAQPVFVGPGGLTGVQRVGTTQINVDTNRDGIPDATYTLPPALQPPNPPDSELVIEDRLSPSQQVLYTRKFQRNGDPVPGCSNGGPVKASFYRLDTPPAATMTPLAVEVCLPASVAIGPVFYDPPVPSPTPRTAVLVTRQTQGANQALLWVDLVSGGHNLDASTYLANVEQTAVGLQFAPAGNAAFVRHATSTPSPQYSLIDLCRSRVAGAGSLTTQGLPAGNVTAHVVPSSTGSLRAELHVNGVPLTGSGINLDNCLGSTVLLQLAKSAPSSGIVQSGEQFDYVLTVTNTGLAPATDVVLEDVVPAGTTFVSATGGRQPDANGVVRWEFGTLSSGAQNQVTLTVRANCPQFQTIANDLYALRSAETGTLSGGPVVVFCIPPPPVRLSITKTGPATVRQGDLLTYTLQYANTGTQTASGAIIEDTLPAGSVFVSATGNGTQVGGLVRWVVNVAAGGSGSVTLTVRAGCLPQVVNSDYSIRSGGLGAVRGPQVVTTVTPASTAPVEVTITSTPITRPPPLQRGDIVQYVITLRNTVAETRNGLSTQVSAGRAARFDQIIDPGGGTATLTSPQTLVWSGSLGPNATATIVVTTRIEECLSPTDTSTQLNDGRPIEVVDTCNRVLGSSPAPAPFAVLPPVVATLTALGIGGQQIGFGGLVQAARAGAEIDLQVTLTNQSLNPEAAVSFRLVLPPELTPVGMPPFVPPTHASAVYDDATRTISWNGAMNAGETVLVTFRVVASSGTCSTRIALSGSVGACQTLGTSLTILSVPDLPAEKHIIGSDHRLGLWMFRPGVDTDLRNLLCFPGEIYTGIDRAANGDVWVAGLPSYRFNPATLELQVVDGSTIRPPDFHNPVDVAIDPAAASPRPIFLLPGQQFLSRLVQFDPVAGQATVVRDGLPPMRRIVIDGQKRIAGIIPPDPAAGRPGGVILVDPLSPANDRILSDPAFPSLDLNLLDVDTDGTFVVGVPVDPLTFAGTQNLVRVDPGTAGPGTFSLIVSDLAALIPPPPLVLGKHAFHALALGASGDVYLGRIEVGSLGVLHGSTPPSGETLAIGRNVVDLEYVDPSPAPPPPAGPINIEVTETVLVADAVDLLPGIILEVAEQVTVQDTVELLPGLFLQIDEQIVVDDAPEVTVPDNTPAGADVVVALRDSFTGRTVLVRFPLVTRSGTTMFTSRADGPSPPPGFFPGEPPIVYDVSSTAVFTGPAIVCLNASEQRFLNLPRIFHFEGASWVDRTASIDVAAGLVCAGVATFSPFALFQAADGTPPVTTVVTSPGPNAAGWNRTEVALAVSAADGSGGSGIRRVQVSLTGAQTGTLTNPTAPIIIAAEGITTATYFAEDNAGNVEAAKTFIVRIDRTPPELETRFDLQTLNLAVFGVDALSGVPAGPVHPSVLPWPVAGHPAPDWHLSGAKSAALQQRRYEIGDAAGNRTAMWVHVLPRRDRDHDTESHQLAASITALRYGDEGARAPSPNELSFTAAFEKGHRLKRVTQTMSVAAGKRRRSVEASYNARRGITTIKDGKNGSIERAGLVWLRLETSGGELSVQY
jgi:uncharacterized repeat protein (TIGR01451 family)